MNTHRSTVVGVFHSRNEADRAVDDLRKAGFREDQIGVVARDAEGHVTNTSADASGSHAGEGAVAGALAGAGVGGLVGLGVLAGVIPVIGPAIAAGTLGTILLNAAGGAAIAGIGGALIGMGIPEEDAKYYEGELHSGRYLVTVTANERATEAWTIMQRHGAYNRQNQATAASHTATTGSAAASHTAASSYTAASHTAASTGSTTSHAATSHASAAPAATSYAASRTAEGQTMQLHEEQLHAQKQPVQTGEVHVRKEVVTEHKTLEVPVQREEVVIERHPVSGRAASSGDIRPGEEIRIPVKEEQVRVEKTPVVTEEVSVGKRQVHETEQVSGTVRKEQVRVEQEGDVNVRGNAADVKTRNERTPRKDK